MRPSHRRSRLRRHACWWIALVAALLNAGAPALAYAIGQPLHELAGGRPGGPLRVLPRVAADRDVGDTHGRHAGQAGHARHARHAAPASHAPHAAPAAHAAHAGHAAHAAHPAHAAPSGHAVRVHLAPADVEGDCTDCRAHAHHDPAAPHCPYCLDFAAGAPLAPSVPRIAATSEVAGAIIVGPAPRVDARPSLRLAHPRGPPVRA